jgi:putative PIG3 family NAD(P)H quinone oxidoreductase
MRAVVVQTPGGPEQLQIARVPAPVLTAGCIEIEVSACALNRADLLQRRGLYAPPPGASEILGLECAGRVRAVAPGVLGFAPGERVMALLAGGGYAERVVVPASLALHVPETLSFTEAAALPEAFLTASEALYTLGQLAPANWVLIHGAAGGVGSAAVQLAKASGAHVIACAGSATKLAWLQQLGADRVVNYRETDFAPVCLELTGGRGVDVIVDFVGADYAERHQHCLAEGGRWIIVGLLGGAQAKLDFGVLLRRRLQLSGLVMRTRSLADKSAIVERFARQFLPLFGSKLRPSIDRVYPLAEVQSAHERMERNENLGKIVLQLERSS